MKKSISLFFIFLGITTPLFLSAESRNVLINEIAWMGTPVAGIEEKQWWRYEWFELYNAGDAIGMLDGWTVELSREKIDFKIPLSGTISANGYFLVGASEKILNLDLNYKNLGGKFNNSGQRVVLKNKLGEIMDEVDTTLGRSGSMSWPAGDNKTKQTMERKAGSDPALGEEWQTSADPGGTPKASNSAGAVKESLVSPSYPHLGETKDEGSKTEKDLGGSSSFASSQLQSFQSRVPIVNPITLLAGLLALGFSGVLLLVKRSLALRQRSGQASRQERQKS